MGKPIGYRQDVFYRMGLFSHDKNKIVIAFSIAVFVGLGSLIALGSEFTEAFDGDDMESYQAYDLVTNAFSTNESEGDSGFSGSRAFTVIYAHNEWNASDARFANAVNLSLSKITNHSSLEFIQTPWTVDENVSSWH